MKDRRMGHSVKVLLTDELGNGCKSGYCQAQTRQPLASTNTRQDLRHWSSFSALDVFWSQYFIITLHSSCVMGEGSPVS